MRRKPVRKERKPGEISVQTKTSVNFATGLDGGGNPWIRFRITRKLLSFRNANHSTENFGRKIKWNGVSENLGILREVVLFSCGNFEKCSSIHRRKFMKIQNFSSNEKLPRAGFFESRLTLTQDLKFTEVSIFLV